MPVRWWLVAAVGVGLAGAELFPGFDVWVAVTVYVALVLVVGGLLLAMSRSVVVVDATGLRAGGRTLALDEVADAVALDPADTRHRLGPGADPAAHVVTRGYVRTAVLVRPVHAGPVPYWLVSSRRPDELVAALTGAVSA